MGFLLALLVLAPLVWTLLGEPDVPMVTPGGKGQIRRLGTKNSARRTGRRSREHISSREHSRPTQEWSSWWRQDRY